ncbi:MAG: LrgB family protein [Clostridia bacterium]|nr:LrgB family protein [Clostridia bacterium]
MELFQNSVFFGIFLTFFAYGIGLLCKKKLKLALFNPILIAVFIIILILVSLNIDYDTYQNGAGFISCMITPSTVCLAVPLYEKLDILKKNYKALIIGISSGVLTSLLNILLFAFIFSFDHATYATFLPKSITTAIGMGVSEELGGYAAITAAVIIITGIIGNMLAEVICKVFKITEPVAKGVAIGTSSHAMGTAKAMEIGEIEGAVSSLSLVLAGVITVVGASVFANFW